MKLVVPKVYLLCAASAAAAFFVGRASVKDASKEHSGSGGDALAGSKISAHPESGGEGGGVTASNIPATPEGRKTEFDRLFANPYAKDRLGALSRLIAGMDTAELREAWARNNLRVSMWSGAGKQAISDAILARWIEIDAEGIEGFLSDLTPLERSYANTIVSGLLARRDIDSGFAFARALAAPDEKTLALNAILEVVAETDVGAAWALAKRSVDELTPVQGKSLLIGFLVPLAATDPERALRLAAEIDNADWVSKPAEDAIGALAAIDPTAAMDWCGKNGDRYGKDFSRSAIQGWARTDPEAAAAYVRAHPEVAANEEVIHALARGWSERDFDSCKNWMAAIDDPEMKAVAVSGMIGAHVLTRPQEMAELMLSHGDSPKVMLWLGNLGSSWASLDPAAALAWTEGNPLPARRLDEFRSRLLESWSNASPSEAAAHLDEIEDAATRRSASASVIARWATQNLEETAQWAANLVPGPVQDGAMAGLASNYARKDPEQASAWLNGFPEGTTRDHAVRSFVGAITRDNPEMAWQWAATIGDPMRRGATLESVAERLLRQDREKARARIEESTDLSEEAKWRLLNSP